MTKPISPTSTGDQAGTITLVPVKQLRESPFNPRKTYGQAALQELADSIKAQGILQPIVARPLPAGQQDIWVRHEIVFGHRRFRAAQLAELEVVPVVLRAFTDEQAALAQVAENLQRQDVTAFEEADSFARLHSTHGMSADDIAAGVNKSRSYVYGRLKLAKVAPEVRKAVTDDGLGAEAALEVARLPSHAMQKIALKKIRPYSDWLSYRDAKAVLRNMFTCDTAKARFDIADANLAKLAGPCTTCPKRAGNDPDLQDVLGAGVCTDSECFGLKEREHIRLDLIVLANQGHPVIQGAQAETLLGNRPQYAVPAGYEDLQAGDWIGQGDAHDHRTYAEMLELLEKAGQVVPKTTVIAAQGVMRHFLSDAQVDDVLQRAGALLGETAEADTEGTDTPSTAARAPHGAARDEDDRRDWTPAELVATDTEAWARVKDAVMRNLLTLPRTTDDLRAILLTEYDQADGFGPMSETMGLDAELDAARVAWEADDSAEEPFSEQDWWRIKLASMSADALGALLLGCKLWDLMGYGQRYKTRETAACQVALAERYGVDVVAAARPEVNDDAGCAGGPRAQASAPGEQLDAFGPVPA